MKKFLLALAAVSFLAPSPAGAAEELDTLLYRLNRVSPFLQFRIIEEIGDLGTPEAIDALITLFTDEELRWMAVRQLTMLRAASVPPLLEALKSGNDDTIRFAAYTLGEIRAAAAVAPIITLLDHPEPEVRQNAVFALGTIRSSEATDALISALDDEDSVVRGYAATALGEIGDPKAKEALLAALKREDSSLVNMASSLIDLGSDKVVEILIEKLRDPNPNNRLYAIYALGRVNDPQEIEPLIAVLASEEIGWLAAQALVRIGSPAVPPLLESLFADDRNVRLYSTYALGEIGDIRAGRGLLRMFRDEDELVRDTAVDALIALGDPNLVPAVSRELSSEDPAMRQKALEVLGHLGDAALTETFTSYLEDPDADVVKSAILALGRTASEKACRPLASHLDSSRPDIQDALRKAFTGIGTPAALCLLDTLQFKGTLQESRAIYILGKLKAGEAVPDLLRYLRHPEPAFRRMATVALTEIADPRAEEHFVNLLTDPDPTLRMYASVGLMNIGGRIAIKLLLASLGNPDTQWLAVKILDKIAERDIDTLIDALKDERTRWYAQQALVELDGQILPEMEERLKSDDPLTRETIAMILGSAKDRRAVKPLLEALQSDERLVRTSAASLVEIGDPAAVPPLIEMLSSGSEEIRLYAAYALGGLKDLRAVDPLLGLLTDPGSNIRGVAAHSLGEIGSRRATRPLLLLLEDPSENVRLTAVHALGKLHDWQAVNPLRELLQNDSSGRVRVAARKVLDDYENLTER
jgi:HEAT repeat protein